MTIHTFQETFDSGFADFIKDKLATLQVEVPEADFNLFFTQAGRIAGRGKRVRPYLCDLAYRAYGGKGNITPVLHAIELFHTFCLVHDDIIDADGLRRGVQTVHALARDTYAGTSNSQLLQRSADGQGILVGDLLFSWVFELMTDCAEVQKHPQALKQFFAAVQEVVAGQMLDVHLTMQDTVTRQQILNKMRMKTAGYTFVEPLRMGYLLAGNKELNEEMDQMAHDLGMAFQMQDDLLDVLGDEESIGKPTMSDMEDRQHTLLTQYIFDHGTKEEQQQLRLLMGQASVQDAATLLKSLLESSGSVTALKSEMEDHFVSAKAAAAGLRIPNEQKQTLIEFIEYVESRSA